MKVAQAKVAALEITGQSGGGLVSVLLNGSHECKRVMIDDSLMSDDKEMLEDLVTAAMNDAVQRLSTESQEIMSKVTSGMNLPAGMSLPF